MMKIKNGQLSSDSPNTGLRARLSALITSITSRFGRAGRKTPDAPLKAKTLAAAKGDDDLMSTPPR